MSELRRARELLDEAEANVTVVGLAHAKVALDAGLKGTRDEAQAALQADRRIHALFQRECGVPCEQARCRLRDARQLLIAIKQEAV